MWRRKERTHTSELRNLQGSVLDFIGPLTSLWVDLLDTKIKIRGYYSSNPKDPSYEGRPLPFHLTRAAADSLVPNISVEDSKEKSTTLLGESFKDKATKRMEEEKFGEIY